MKIQKYMCDGCRQETAELEGPGFWLSFVSGEDGLILLGRAQEVNLFRGGRTRLDFCSMQCFLDYLRLYAEEAKCEVSLGVTPTNLHTGPGPVPHPWRR